MQHFLKFHSTYLDLFEEQYLSDDPDIKEAISRSFSDNTNERLEKN